MNRLPTPQKNRGLSASILSTFSGAKKKKSKNRKNTRCLEDQSIHFLQLIFLHLSMGVAPSSQKQKNTKPFGPEFVEPPAERWTPTPPR